MTRSHSQEIAFKAARLAVLYELDRAGYLEGMTQQQIAEMLEVGHRSTAMRDLRMLEDVKSLVEGIKERLQRERDIFFDDAAQA